MSMSNLSLFGKQLRKCRKQAQPVKVTQQDLADAIEKDPSLISQYENGKSLPERERLDEMVQVLRNKGVPEENLDKLYEYAGYDQVEISDPIISKLLRLLDNLGAQSPARSLFLELLQVFIDDWFKYHNALKEFEMGWHSDVQEAFQRLLDDTVDELPTRKRLRIRILQRLSDSYRFDGEPVTAEKTLNDAIQLAKQIGQPEHRTLADIYLQRGNIRRRLNKWQEAKLDYNESYKIYKEIQLDTGENQSKALAVIERKLAGVHLFKGEPLQALEHCKRSLAHCERFHDPTEKIKTKQHKAWADALLGRWEDALQGHKEVVDSFADVEPSLKMKAKSYRYLADMYKMCGLVDLAEEAYQRAFDNLEQFIRFDINKEPLIYGMIQLGQGAVYRSHKQKYSLAKQSLDDSLHIHIQSKARHHEALTRNELGRLALAKGNYNEAAQQFARAKTLFENLDNDYYGVAVQYNLADLAYQQGNYLEARAHAVTALKLAEQHDFPVHQIRTQLFLGKINLVQPDDQEPLTYYLSALQQARKLNNLYLVHELLAKIADQPHLPANREAVLANILRLSGIVAKEWSVPSKIDTNSPSSIQAWLAELDSLRAQLGNPKSTNSFTHVHGLMIGINRYQYLPPLKKAVTDAQDVYTLLNQNSNPNVDLTLLLDAQATKESISSALDRLAKSVSPEDIVVIFFSGHGAQRIGGFTPGEFLCPVTAERNNLGETAISNDELTVALKAIPARHIVVFLDACHSGGVGQPKDGVTTIKAGLSEETVASLADGKGRVVISSCRPDEVSWELAEMRNGLFTHYLLEGLRGAAASMDGIVRIFKLFEYVAEQVPKEMRQHPFFKGEMEKNFPIISYA